MNTIRAIKPTVSVSNSAVQDDSYDGVLIASSREFKGFTFVWPYSYKGTNNPYPADRIQVKRVDRFVRNAHGNLVSTMGATELLHHETEADILSTNPETGEIVVSFGTGGFSGAAARWLKDNVVNSR